MRFALIGDIVGKSGVGMVVDAVPILRQEYQLDFIIANAENAYNGSGLTPGQYKTLIAAGLDGITLGDHAYKKREIYNVLETQPDIVRPANFPSTAPGNGVMTIRREQQPALTVVSLLGRVFMRPVDCPFEEIDRILESLPDDAGHILVEFHAEATSDMEAMGYHLDGRVAAVLGTHTHVPTADEQILPQGTAFQCDVGMTGPHSGVIGRNAERVLKTIRTFQPTSFDVAEGQMKLHATMIETNDQGRAIAVERIRWTPPEEDSQSTTG